MNLSKCWREVEEILPIQYEKLGTVEIFSICETGDSRSSHAKTNSVPESSFLRTHSCQWLLSTRHKFNCDNDRTMLKK